MDDKDVISAGFDAKMEIERRREVHRNRGFIVEDYLSGVSVRSLEVRYNATASEIEGFIDSYKDDNNPVSLSFKTKRVKDLMIGVRAASAHHQDFHKFMSDCKRVFLEEKLSAGEPVSVVAKRIGVSRTYLYEMINEFNIETNENNGRN